MHFLSFSKLLLLITLTFIPLISTQDEPSDADLEVIKDFEASLANQEEGEAQIGSSGENSEELPKNKPVRPSSNEESIYDKKRPNKNDANEEGSSGENKEILPLNKGEGECNCVKYFLCELDSGADNETIIGQIDIRLGGLAKNSPCSHYFDICCKHMKDESKVGGVGGNGHGGSEAPFEHKVCGKRNVGGVGFRITGAMDGESQFGEFPWMAAIVRQEAQGNKPPLNIFLCGGSLIHPKVILTAAHCVFGKNQMELKVRLGEWDTQTPDEPYVHQDRHVSKIIVHEEYYAGALYNDVALLILDEEVKFAPNVDTICLPPPNINFDGQRCYASGWGKDTFGKEGKYQVILKKVDVPVVPRGKCQNALRKTRLGPYFRLDESFVCAGGELGRDTCRGDGGSPLVCKLPNSESYAQFGIVAWGIGCGTQTPGVYVNVPKFVPWIEEKIKGARLNTKYFKNI